MFSLRLLTTPPPEPFASQVQQLAIDSLTSLSSVALAPSNPLYPLYQYGLGLEVHQYLQAVGGGQAFEVELLLALDALDPSQVLGFALYLPVVDAAQACTLLYLAVLSSHRHKGIGRSLLAGVIADHPHTEAASPLTALDWFEAQGWHLVGASGPQVLMSTRPTRALGNVPRLDVAPLYRTVEVRQIHAYLLKQHGRRAMIDAEKQRDYRLDQLGRQAAQQARARLG